MKRRVEVTIGMPEGFAEKDPILPGLPHPDESFYINFVEEESETDESGYTAQTPCLCGLRAGTEAWLNGGTFEEVVAVMDHERNSPDHE